MSRTVRIRKPMPRGCLVFMGLVLFAAGVAGLIVLGNTLYKKTAAIHAWEPVPCTVLQAETDVRGTDFDGHLLMEVNAAIAWEYKGVRHTGGKLDADTGFRIAQSINSKEEICYHLRQSPQQTCYVNPDKPDEAILRLPGWWPVWLFGSLALVLVVLGAGVLLACFIKRASPQPGAPGCFGLTFVAFLGLACMSGGFAVWWFGVRGTTDWSSIGARMKEVPCTVVSAAVEKSGGGRNDTPTYYPHIYYRYDWDGRRWHSEWYNFSKSAPGSSDRSKAEQTVQRFRKGTAHTCWVDPEQPWVTVLEKSGGKFAWLWVPAALLALLGGFFLVLSLLKLCVIFFAGKRQAPRPSGPPPLPPEP